MWLGSTLTDTHPTQTKYKVIHVTETETVTEQKEVYVQAPSCKEAISYSLGILHAAKQYEVTMSEVLDILVSVRQLAASSPDPVAANQIYTRVLRLQPKTLSAAEILGNDLDPYASAVQECKQQSDQDTEGQP